MFNISGPLHVTNGTADIILSVDPSATKDLTITTTNTAADIVITIAHGSTNYVLRANGTTTANMQYPIIVRQNGVDVASNSYSVNFTAGVSATDAGSGVASVSASATGPQIATYYDAKAVGTAGGTSSASATWGTRTLNTAGANNNISGASLASNQFTLPNGTYYIEASAPSLTIGITRLRLKNVTDTTYPLYSINSRQTTSALRSDIRTYMHGIFDINSSKAFSIEQYTTTLSPGVFGYGSASGGLDDEIFTVVSVMKIP